MTTKGIIQQLNFLCDFGIFKTLRKNLSVKSYVYTNKDNNKSIRIDIFKNDSLVFDISIYDGEKQIKDIQRRTTDFHTMMDFKLYLSELMIEYTI